jgi:hypothetical protein
MSEAPPVVVRRHAVDESNDLPNLNNAQPCPSLHHACSAERLTNILDVGRAGVGKATGRRVVEVVGV